MSEENSNVEQIGTIKLPTKELSIFETLSQVDYSKYVKKLKVSGKEFSYLSWADAWYLLKTVYPQADYRILESETCVLQEGSDPLITKAPYFQSDLGILVRVAIVIGKENHIVQMPVLSPTNKAMKSEPYEYTVKGWNGKPDQVKTVPAADMSDINNAIMRALTKACGLFGLGLPLYQGEDLQGLVGSGESTNTHKVIFSGVTFDNKDAFKKAVGGFMKFNGADTTWVKECTKAEGDTLVLKFNNKNNVTAELKEIA